MKPYLVSLAVYVAFSFVPVRAESLTPGMDDINRKAVETAMQPVKPIDTPWILGPVDTYGLQRRMNQQYQQQQLQDRFDQQQQQIQQEVHREHMRNNGWGRPGLDGGY